MISCLCLSAQDYVRITGTQVRLRKQPSTSGTIYRDARTDKPVYGERGNVYPLQSEFANWYGIQYSEKLILYVSKSYSEKFFKAEAKTAAENAAAKQQNIAADKSQNVATKPQETVADKQRTVADKQKTVVANKQKEEIVSLPQNIQANRSENQVTRTSQTAAEQNSATASSSILKQRAYSFAGKEGQYISFELSIEINDQNNVSGQVFYPEARSKKKLLHTKQQYTLSGTAVANNDNTIQLTLKEDDKMPEAGTFYITLEQDNKFRSGYWTNGSLRYELNNILFQ